LKSDSKFGSSKVGFTNWFIATTNARSFISIFRSNYTSTHTYTHINFLFYFFI